MNYQSRAVLVLEDDPLMLNIIQLSLSDLDLEVAIYMDGMEAYEHIQKDTPDLIICENSVPKMDSLSLVRNLNELPNKGEIPIILMSHRKDSKLVEQATDMGIVHILQKPLYPAELKAIAMHLLNL